MNDWNSLAILITNYDTLQVDIKYIRTLLAGSFMKIVCHLEIGINPGGAITKFIIITLAV